jgi:hypothetical protein
MYNNNNNDTYIQMTAASHFNYLTSQAYIKRKR